MVFFRFPARAACGWNPLKFEMKINISNVSATKKLSTSWEYTFVNAGIWDWIFWKQKTKKNIYIYTVTPKSSTTLKRLITIAWQDFGRFVDSKRLVYLERYIQATPRAVTASFVGRLRLPVIDEAHGQPMRIVVVQELQELSSSPCSWSTCSTCSSIMCSTSMSTRAGGCW